MSFVEKAKLVEALFASLEKEITSLKGETGIYCVENCIYCCTTPKVVATVLEFYPLAVYLYETGQAESFLERIKQNGTSTICPVLNSDGSRGPRLGCSEYAVRGLICRLFAFNYSTDKHGIRKIATCKKIKITQPETITKANNLLLERPVGPKASGYYSQLQSIDFTEGQTLYPIAEAIRIAIEKVLTYYYYLNIEEGK
ncbi:MAG: YkgJ family cysteine cluster protein [Salinivirgaceae bacterium]|nr:YkgJ family cysteine cluster protein [Salinivirgaceae bacterium]